MAKVDLGQVVPYTMYTQLSEVAPNISNADITIENIMDGMVDNSVFTMAVWSPTYTGLALPDGIGNYVLLEVVKKQSTHISVVIHDLDNNVLYTRGKYGGVVTAWKGV